MKLNFNQLDTHLAGPLAALYFISGDEPFQVDQATRRIRETAQQQGYTDRQIHHVDKSFDWGLLGQSADSFSLFAERKLIELRIPSGKPGDAGSKALQAYAENLPEDTLLLIISGKLESAQSKSKWYTALEKVGVTLQIWPVEAEQLPSWLKQRMQYRGMQPSQSALNFLAERIEGNLLAADQELEKLRMVFGEGSIELEQVEEAVADSARYDAFKLVDSALQGDAARVSRILHGLRAEGEDVLSVLGALNYQLHQLEQIANDVQQGESLQQVFGRYRVWDKRKPVLSAGLNRHSLRHWRAFLLLSARIDRMAKGLIPGKPWDELLQLMLRIAGVALFPLTPASFSNQ